MNVEFFSQFDNQRLAAEYLAEKLFSESLSLLIGAGVSSKVGLPSWPELVRRCCEVTGIDSSAVKDESIGDFLYRVMDSVKRNRSEEEFKSIVWDQLYRDKSADLVEEPTPLLRALGALIIGSRRGSVNNIANLNFDSVLEWYLQLHGYVDQVVDRWPVELRASDITIFHPHGYLAFDDASKGAQTELVFDTKSVDRRLNPEKSPWTKLIHHLLLSRTFLSIGCSGEDYLVRAILTGVSDVTVGDKNIVGFWMCGPKFDEHVKGQLKDRLICPLSFDSFDDYPPFLYSICQHARDLAR